jgi:hypothetical protein
VERGEERFGVCGHDVSGIRAIFAVIHDAGCAQFAAVDQSAAPARLAMAAPPSEPANADALPRAPADHIGTEPVGELR